MNNAPAIRKSTGPVYDDRTDTVRNGVWIGFETDQEDEGVVCRDVIIFDADTGLEVKRLDFCSIGGERFTAPEVRDAVSDDTLDPDVDIFLRIAADEAATVEQDAREALAAAERQTRYLAQFD